MAQKSAKCLSTYGPIPIRITRLSLRGRSLHSNNLGAPPRPLNPNPRVGTCPTGFPNLSRRVPAVVRLGLGRDGHSQRGGAEQCSVKPGKARVRLAAPSQQACWSQAWRPITPPIACMRRLSSRGSLHHFNLAATHVGSMTSARRERALPRGHPEGAE